MRQLTTTGVRSRMVLRIIIILALSQLSQFAGPLAAPLGIVPQVALADDATVSSCTEEAFDTALDTVQNTGGGTIAMSCSGTISFSGAKTITSNVTIVGNGNVTFDGSDNFQLLRVNFAASLKLVNLTLQNGSAFGGGAILNAGTLTVIASTLTSNTATDQGGGITNIDTGTATITGTTIDNNTALQGGGINNHGTLNVIASTLSGNTTTGGLGGGIANTGTATIIATTIDNNSAIQGGGIVNTDSLTVTASTVSGNMTTSVGGGIINTGTATITATTINNNNAFQGGGIVNNFDGNLTLTASTVSGNTATDQGGGIAGVGGGITNTGTTTITSSTFSGNSTDGQGSAIFNSTDATLALTASTISGNTDAGAVFGGAITNDGDVTAKSTIVADNSSLDNLNCANGVNGTITSQGYNLSDNSDCGFIGMGDIEDSEDVNLVALADNGGPTQTMLPQAGSDATEATPPADCATLSSPTGQRGVVRPQDTNCEIGAVELGPVPVQIFAAYDLGPIFEGGDAEVVAVAYGPAGASLDYDFDCNNDGSYQTQGSGSGSLGSASCTFPDEGDYPVGVQVGDGTTSAASQTTVSVQNVAPTITDITTDGPAAQSDPVTITVTASDPGVLDVLSYSFDCDADGSFDIGPQPANSADCPLDPAAATTTINVLVEDDDGGSDFGTVVVGQQVTLCVNYATGAVTGTGVGGQCNGGSVALSLPGPFPQTLCIHPYTSGLRLTQAACAGVELPHIVPDDGPLHYCQNRYTGQLRYSHAGQCQSHEIGGVIPG